MDKDDKLIEMTFLAPKSGVSVTVNQIEIVQLEPDTWHDYKALRLEALHTEPQAFGSKYADNVQHPDSFWRRRLEEAAVGQISWLLFAKSGDRLVGMIGAYVADDSPAVAEIISTYVKPDFRRQGIARALMAALLSAIRKHGTVRIARLIVNVDQKFALQLYQHFEFEIIETVNNRMGDGQFYDGYLMEKSL